MPYTIEQEIFIVQAYYRNGERTENGNWRYNIPRCMEEFRIQFPEDDSDNNCLSRHVKRIVDRFQNTGSVCKGKSPGRTPVINEHIVEEVRTRLVHSPRKPLRQLAQQTGLSYSTARRVVKCRLGLHPYKISVKQELHPLDLERRTTYCHWFNENLRNGNTLDYTFFSDEAWFHLSGYVNSQNSRYWSSENPHVFYETPLHPVKVGVWIAMSRQRIIGPIFFEENISAIRYREILEIFIRELSEEELQRGYFQHDNASAHTAHDNLQYLSRIYDGRIISSGLWPPRSPDLTPLDYYLFGHLKNRVFQTRLHTVDELRNAIIQAIGGITHVFNNMNRRIDACLQSEGSHFEHLL